MTMIRATIGLLVLVAVSACRPSTDPSETAVARMRCLQPDGRLIACDLVLQERGGFEVMLESTECVANGNTVRLTKPVEQVLVEDGCYANAPQEWGFTGPYEVGTAVAMEIEGPRLRFAPGLRVEGAYPVWRLFYEDGGDQDFIDLVLRVTALPE